MAARKLDAQHPDLQRNTAGNGVEHLAHWPNDGGEAAVDRTGQIGHRRQLVEVDPYWLWADCFEVGGHPLQQAGLAVASGTNQCSEPMIGDALGDVDD